MNIEGHPQYTTMGSLRQVNFVGIVQAQDLGRPIVPITEHLAPA